MFSSHIIHIWICRMKLKHHWYWKFPRRAPLLPIILLITPHTNKNISSMNRLSMCSQIFLLAKCGITCIADKYISSMKRIFEFYRLLWRKLTCTDYNCTDSSCDLRYTFWLNLHITCVLKISSWLNLVSHVMQIIHFHHEQITLSAIMLRTTTADHRTTTEVGNLFSP